VRFSITLTDGGHDKVAFARYIDPKHRTSERRWIPETLDVRALRGKTVRLTLVTEIGPSGSGCFDWSVFGDMHFDSAVRGNSKFEKVYSDTNGVSIYKFKSPLPRLSAYVPDGPAALARIADPAFDYDREVVVEGTPPANSSSPPEQAVSGTLDSYGALTVAGRVEVSKPSILMLNDTWFPGWEVLVDGVRTPVLHADYLFRGVALTPGRHRIEFDYRPAPFFRGLALTLGGLVVLIGIGGFALFAEVRDRRAQTGSSTR
jgi:hypothetical protein